MVNPCRKFVATQATLITERIISQNPSNFSALAPVFIPRLINVNAQESLCTMDRPVVNMTKQVYAENNETHTPMLRCYYFNARSLKSKLADLHNVLYSRKYDLIGVSETWLNDKFDSFLLDPSNAYYIYRKDRHSDNSVGRVCIFVAKEYKSLSLNKEFESATEDSEIITCAVLHNNTS